MTYELVKQLKNKGFSQVGPGYYLLGTGIGTISYFTNPPDLRDYEHKIPTLSELIEACTHGNYNFDLGSGVVVGESSFVWTAKCQGKKAEGYTPEKAVAKLWLELNSKNEN